MALETAISSSSTPRSMLQAFSASTRSGRYDIDSDDEKDEGRYPRKGSQVSRANTDAARATTFGESIEVNVWMGMHCRWISPEMEMLITRLQRFVLSILRDWKFDAMIGVVILLNAVTVGLDQHARQMKMTSEHTLVLTIFYSEHIFLAVYCLELFFRFFCLGPGCVQDHWVKFDCVLVCTGIMNTWILEPFVFVDGDGLGPLMVLRMGRLLRLARTVRLLVKFQVLWMLVRGLLTSAGTMLYTLLLLFIILYIFGCIGFELITSNPLREKDPEFASLVEDWFVDLPRIMLTLLQFVCLDSVGGIYRPLIEKEFVLCFYFVGIILVVPIVLMNLVTAVIVNGAIEQAEQDREAMAIHEEQKKQKMVKDLRKIFMHLDEDASGNVTAEEIQKIDAKDKQMLTRVTNMKDPLELFAALDVNQTGELNVEAFCGGIWEVAISKVPLEVKRMEMQVNEIFRSLKELTLAQAAFREQQHQTSVRQTDDLVKLSQEVLQGQSVLRREMRERLERIGKAVGVEELQSDFSPQDYGDRDDDPGASEFFGGPSWEAADGGCASPAARPPSKTAEAACAAEWREDGGRARSSPPKVGGVEAWCFPKPPGVPKDTPAWAATLLTEIRALRDVQDPGGLHMPASHFIQKMRPPSFGGGSDPSPFANCPGVALGDPVFHVEEEMLPLHSHQEMLPLHSHQAQPVDILLAARHDADPSEGRWPRLGPGARNVGGSPDRLAVASPAAVIGDASPHYGPPAASRPRFFTQMTAGRRTPPRDDPDFDPVAGSGVAAGGVSAARARRKQNFGGGRPANGAGLGIGGGSVAMPWRHAACGLGGQAAGAAL